MSECYYPGRSPPSPCVTLTGSEVLENMLPRPLERNVVVRNAHRPAERIVIGRSGTATRGSTPPAGIPGGAHRSPVILSLSLSLSGIAAAPPEQNDFVRHDLCRVHLFAVFVVVAASLEAALDVDLLTFHKVVGQILLPPDNHVGPVGFFLPLIRRLIFPTAGRSHRESRYRRSGRCELGLGISAQIAYKNHLVYAARSHNHSHCNTNA